MKNITKPILIEPHLINLIKMLKIINLEIQFQFLDAQQVGKKHRKLSSKKCLDFDIHVIKEKYLINTKIIQLRG